MKGYSAAKNMLDTFSGMVLIGLTVFAMLATWFWRIDPVVSAAGIVGAMSLVILLFWRFMDLMGVVSCRNRINTLLVSSFVCVVLSWFSYDYQDNKRLTPSYSDYRLMLEEYQAQLDELTL